MSCAIRLLQLMRQSHTKRGGALTVYLDVIFLENLCINCIILLATALINKNTINIIRILLSSLIGSVYAVSVYLAIAPMFSNIILKILLSICMVHVAYNPKNMKTLIKELVLFYLTSFTFGGVAFALLYFVKPQEILIKNGVLIGTYPIKIALTGVIVGFIVITVAFKSFKKKLSKKDMFCDITINFEGKYKTIKAMIDTGNLLKEPITGNPVVVVEKSELLEIVPKNILENSENIITGRVDTELDEYSSRFRVIPFTSLGKENGLLLGIKIDNLQIDYDEQENNIKGAILGIYDKKLTKTNTYNALVGLDIVNGDIQTKREGFYEHIANIKK